MGEVAEAVAEVLTLMGETGVVFQFSVCVDVIGTGPPDEYAYAWEYAEMLPSTGWARAVPVDATAHPMSTESDAGN
jgi:hypothetical protein